MLNQQKSAISADTCKQSELSESSTREGQIEINSAKLLQTLESKGIPSTTEGLPWVTDMSPGNFRDLLVPIEDPPCARAHEGSYGCQRRHLLYFRCYLDNCLQQKTSPNVIFSYSTCIYNVLLVLH